MIQKKPPSLEEMKADLDESLNIARAKFLGEMYAFAPENPLLKNPEFLRLMNAIFEAGFHQGIATSCTYLLEWNAQN